MKEIDLPINQTFSLTIEPQNMDMSQAVDVGDGRFLVPLGNIVDDSISEITEIARKNGGKILYATTSIEQQLESILLRYFMGPFKGHEERRVMFEREILQSSALSYSSKKSLVSKILNGNKILDGKKRNKLQGYLKKIMEWRNAFAHGKIQHDNKAGCFIKYYSGRPIDLSLTDDFWDEVVNSYKECHEILNVVNKKIENVA